MKEKRLYFAIGCTLVILLVGLFLLNSSIKNGLNTNLTNDYISQESNITGQVATNVRNEFQDTKFMLEIASRIPAIHDGVTEPCNQELVQLQTLLGTKFSNLGRVGADGKFQCSINKALVGTNASKLGPYINTIFNDPNHNPVVSSVILPSGSSGYIVAMHVPVFSTTGDFMGTLGGAILLSDIQENILQGVTYAENGHVMLLDSNGDIIYHSDNSLIGKNIGSTQAAQAFTNINGFKDAIAKANENQTGTLRYAYHGTQKIATFTSVQVTPTHNWVVLATVPVSDAQATLDRIGVNASFRELYVGLALSFIALAVLGAYTLYHALRSSQRLELYNANMRGLLDSLSQAVIAFDHTFVITWSNQEAQHLLGTTTDQLTGKRILDALQFINAQTRNTDSSFVTDAALKGATAQIPTHTLIRVGTEEIPVAGSVSPVHQLRDSRQGGIIVVRDLRHEQSETSMQTDFAFASHQFRTPISQVKAALELLEDAKGAKTRREALAYAHTAINSIASLSDHLLELTDIENGRIILEPKAIDVQALVAHIVEQLSRPHKDTVTVTYGSAPSVTTDEHVLGKIISMLLENAIAYRTPDTKVQCWVNTTEEGLELRVTNSGAQISEEDQPHIFGKFFRGSNRASDVPGSGLGLYLAKQYVDLLHGKIWFTSEQDSTTFYLKIPNHHTT